MVSDFVLTAELRLRKGQKAVKVSSGLRDV